jgi:hypothetical protein
MAKWSDAGGSVWKLPADSCFSRIIERKLGSEIFKNTTQIYAAP